MMDGRYRNWQCESFRENYRRYAGRVNQARRERYHDPNDSTYRAQALARA
jgi:hypothetical protein